MIAVTIHVHCLLQTRETFVTAAAGVVTPSHHRRSPRRDRGDVARDGREAHRRPDRAPPLPSESTHAMVAATAPRRPPCIDRKTLADRAFGQFARVTSSSVGLASPCSAIILSTLYRPRRPHGSQTIVSVGPRRSGERSVWRARQVIDDGGARFGRRTRRSKPRSRPASARGRRRHVRAQPAGRIEATALLEALRGGQAATWFEAAGSGCRKSTRVRSHNSKPSKRYLRAENSA